jgi:hypothetical protein
MGGTGGYKRNFNYNHAVTVQLDGIGELVRPGANLTTSGANPTIVSYNANVVKIYNATNSKTSFWNNKYFSLL